MLRCGAGLIGLLVPCVALAQSLPPPEFHASYQTYAAGLPVAEVDSGFSLGQRQYRMKLDYRTTGVAAWFIGGHQSDSVIGTWSGEQALPTRFVGKGQWHGEHRMVEIDYTRHKPEVRRLVPLNLDDREPVPDALKADSIDRLSAVAELIRIVQDTGHCETTVRTYDGRRAIEIEAHTVGNETLEPTERSSFAGKTLRCDFSGRLIAGFKSGGDRAREGKPMHGSAWLAKLAADAPLVPVRMAFETRWFGDATMYLTEIGPGFDLKVAKGD
ncbi:DUF3108 domain-containing protein [Rhodopila sp.]|uniref:DUF3108 domain-containing protein n=1 Tax=Rhodopila sp. TaxID=2480087 RepID=UPI003D0B1FE6